MDKLPDTEIEKLNKEIWHRRFEMQVFRVKLQEAQVKFDRALKEKIDYQPSGRWPWR